MTAWEESSTIDRTTEFPPPSKLPPPAGTHFLPARAIQESQLVPDALTAWKVQVARANGQQIFRQDVPWGAPGANTQELMLPQNEQLEDELSIDLPATPMQAPPPWEIQDEMPDRRSRGNILPSRREIDPPWFRFRPVGLNYSPTPSTGLGAQSATVRFFFSIGVFAAIVLAVFAMAFTVASSRAKINAQTTSMMSSSPSQSTSAPSAIGMGSSSMVGGMGVNIPGFANTPLGREILAKQEVSTRLDDTATDLTYFEMSGQLLVVGGLFFIFFLLDPDVTKRRDQRFLLKIVSIGSVIGLAATVASVLVRAGVENADTGAGYGGMFNLSTIGSNTDLSSAFGYGTILSFCGLLAAFLLANYWRRAVGNSNANGETVGSVLHHFGPVAARRELKIEKVWSLVAIAMVLGTYLFIGHPSSTKPVWLNAPMGVAHVASVGVWFGGLALLAVTLRRIVKHDGWTLPAAKLMARFSKAVTAAIIVVAGSGAVLSVVQLGGFSHLFHNAFKTDYGLTLIVKLAFVGLAAAVGGYNHTRLVPAVEAQHDAHAAWAKIRNTVATEAFVILVGVLISTAILTTAGSPATM